MVTKKKTTKKNVLYQVQVIMPSEEHIPQIGKAKRKALLGFYGKKLTLNDDDRAQWIDNDEGLYNWWRGSRMSKRAFIKENRKELTDLIMAELNRPPRR